MPQSLWDDPDVRKVWVEDDGTRHIAWSMLDDPQDVPGSPDKANFQAFMRADMAVEPNSTLPELLEAVHAGVRFLEQMTTDFLADGFKKFVLVQTGYNVVYLWENHRDQRARMFGDYIVAMLSENGWQPDGGETAVGAMHQYIAGTVYEIRGGLARGTDGSFMSPNGDEARHALGLPTRSAYPPRSGQTAAQSEPPKRPAPAGQAARPEQEKRGRLGRWLRG